VKVFSIAKQYSVFVQTDKAVYKPLDKVLFRVLVLDSETKPFRYYALNVNITDPDGKVLSEQIHDGDDDFFPLVFNSSYTIGDNPFYGNWTIKVTVNGDDIQTEKLFEVKEYVLPYFEVFIDTQEFVTFSDGEISLDVYAKYTFDEFVRGKLKYNVTVKDSRTMEPLKRNNEVEIKNITGKAKITLTMRELDIKVIIRDLFVIFDVEFEDTLTAEKIRATRTVTVQRKKMFFIEVFRPKLKFKPGFPYQLTVSVLKSDRTLENYEGDIKLVVDHYYGFEKCLNMIDDKQFNKQDTLRETLRNGRANFELEVAHNCSYINVTATYNDSERVITILKVPSNTREYLGAKVKGDKK
jgi:CD109 antigen